MDGATTAKPLPMRRNEVTAEDTSAAVSGMKSFKLAKPITIETGGGPQEVKELQLRLPTFGDIMSLPLPYHTFSQGGRMEIVPNGSALQQWIEALSGSKYSRSDIAPLAARDGMRIYDWLCEEINVGSDPGN